MHGQPPLWNAVLGLGLHVFPSHWPQAWHVVFLGPRARRSRSRSTRCCACSAVGSAASVAVAAALLRHPGGAAVRERALLRLPDSGLRDRRRRSQSGCFVRRQTFARGLLVFGLAGALVLSRTLFQVWWLLILLAVLLVACSGHRRDDPARRARCRRRSSPGSTSRTSRMYGVPSTTSWTGMGVARVAVLGLPLAERRRLVAEGKLHPRLAREAARAARAVHRRRSPSRRADGDPRARRGVRLRSTRATSQNKTYIRISRLYWKDDLWIVRHRPGAYAPCGRARARGLLHLADGRVAAPGRRGRDRRLRPRRQPGRLRPGRDREGRARGRGGIRGRARLRPVGRRRAACDRGRLPPT